MVSTGEYPAPEIEVKGSIRTVDCTARPVSGCAGQGQSATVSIVAKDLFESYRRTSFFANTPRGRLRLRVGERSQQLDHLLAECRAQSWAYVTAFNPGSILLDGEENKRRQADLEQEVARRGYSAFHGEGVGDDGAWPPERSLLIMGIGKPEALELGRRIGQRAILYGIFGEPAVLLPCA